MSEVLRKVRRVAAEDDFKLLSLEPMSFQPRVQPRTSAQNVI
jgi:hypothetical protein